MMEGLLLAAKVLAVTGYLYNVLITSYYNNIVVFDV
jgi:hypothetical protein